MRFEEKLILLSLYNNPSENKYIYKEKFFGEHDTPKTSLIYQQNQIIFFFEIQISLNFLYAKEKSPGKVDVINIFISLSSSLL